MLEPPTPEGEMDGATPDGKWMLHSPDVLKNLSRLRGKCLECGKTNIFTIIKETPEGWCVCSSCGAVFKVHNTIIWS